MWRTIAGRVSYLSRLTPPKSHFSFLHMATTSLRHLRPISSAADPLPCSLSDDPDLDLQHTPLPYPEGPAKPEAFESIALGNPPGRQQWQKTETIGSNYAELKRRQIKMETEEWERAANEYLELLAVMCQKKLAPNLPYVQSLLTGWFEPLRDLIAKEQEVCREERCRHIYGPHFTQLSAEKMAVITMHKLMGLLMSKKGNVHVLVVKAALEVGSAIENEIRIQSFFEKTLKKNGKSPQASEGESMSKDQVGLRKKVTGLIKKQNLFQVRKIVKEYNDAKPWGQEVQAKVGSRLIEMLINTAYIQTSSSQSADSIFDVRPAFYHTYKNISQGKSKTKMPYGVIECDPIIRQGMERTANHMVIPYMPMLVPPLKWTGFDKGAHFFLPSYIMRFHGSRHQKQVVKRASKQEMQMIYEALDILGNTKWRINKRILSIVEKVRCSGVHLAGLIGDENIPLPDKADIEDETAIARWRWKRWVIKRENAMRHSQRCDIELKLAVARKMKDEEGFYYPHNIDFRGRAYPLHPHLNHLASDLCRGVLEFAEGRPLGKSGLYWLKIHLANLYGGGIDKLSYEGRIAFAENHIEDIFDSADNPLDGRRWWLDAEEPFQCLAVCINLSEALRNHSPETTISHIPVHQDGSCNGLQHYAALGRDKVGAAAVNLISGDRPADVYTEIASRVLQIMEGDSEKDPTAYPHAQHAKFLVDQVDRKFVKQTVMTSVYGVTFSGARQQIGRRLKERGLNNDEEFFHACCYATKVTLAALEEMFQTARGIMNWLGDCARIIAMENHPVKWVSPIGLPIVQPYRKWRNYEVKTSLQTLTMQKETDKVMIRRQKTAFPPNFVHSLDGSHMMMTAIACKKAGLCFAEVHDSFWTHACDVDIMNKILRETFVELYEKPILENLLENFQKSFPSIKSEFPSLPERGSFDLTEVLNSTYFFN